MADGAAASRVVCGGHESQRPRITDRDLRQPLNDSPVLRARLFAEQRKEKVRGLFFEDLAVYFTLWPTPESRIVIVPSTRRASAVSELNIKPPIVRGPLPFLNRLQPGHQTYSRGCWWR